MGQHRRPHSFAEMRQGNPQPPYRWLGYLCCVLLLPYTTEYSTHLWGGFPSSIARQPRGCQYPTIRLRKALWDMFPTPTFLAPILSQLWRYIAWEIGPGVCDIHRRNIHRRVRYTATKQILRLDHYESHRGSSIVVLPAANLEGPPEKCGLLTLARPSVRSCSTALWARSCATARFVSGKQQRQRFFFFEEARGVFSCF